MKKILFLMSLFFLINAFSIYADGDSYNHTLDDYEYQKQTNHHDGDSSGNENGDSGDEGKKKEEGDGGDGDKDTGASSDSSGSSSSSSSSSSDSGSSSSSGSSSTVVTPAQADLDAIISEKDELETGVSGIQSIGDLNLSQGAADDEAAGDKELKKKEEEAKKVTEENKKKVKEDGESVNAGKAGDPVKISKGTYEQSESDIEIWKDMFSISRRYESDNQVIGSLGYAWITNLDERIILGTDANLEKEIIALKKYINKVDDIIEGLEDDLKESYHVTSIYEAKNELAGRITDCKNKISKLSALLGKIKTYKDTYPVLLFKSYIEAVEKKEEDVKKIKSSAETKLSANQSAYDRVDKDLAEIRYLKSKRSSAASKLEEKNKLLAKKEKIEERNKKVLFKGMSELYDGTGFNTIVLIDEEGYPCLLEEADGRFKKTDYNKYSSYQKSDDYYRIYMSDGSEKLYDTFGFLIQIKDRNKNLLTIERDSEEKISDIKTSFGQHFKFEYTAGKISKITNVRKPDDFVKYEYKENKLISVRDRDGDNVLMGYDLNNRLASLNKCDGSTVLFTYGEQTSDGRMLATSTTNEEGYAESFEYNLSGKRTDYVDHDGNKTSYWYDDSYRTLREVRPDGSEIRNEYDSKGNLIRLVENGDATLFSYDDNGKRISAGYSDGSREIWTYDSFNLVTSYTDRDGVKEEWRRDERGNIVEYLKAGKRVYSQEFDSKGQLIKHTVYGQNTIVTDYTYDGYGNIKSENCGGIITEYEYDELDRPVKIKIDGKVVTEYSYDLHKTVQKNYNGLETTCITNGRKDLVKISQKDCLTGKFHETKIEYDKRHLPVRVYTGDGEAEKLINSYLYTAEGKLKAEITHGIESWVKLYSYNGGQISEFKQFKTSVDLRETEEVTVVESAQSTGIETTADSGNIYTQKIFYKLESGNRKLLTVTDGLGFQNLFEYDSYGNLVKYTDGNGEVRLSSYTKAGRLNGEQSSHGGWYDYGYTDGLMTWTGEHGKNASKAEYYPDGNLKSETDRYGKVTYYSYDKQGRVSSIQTDVKKIWYVYDSLDRIKSQVVGRSFDKETAVYYITYDYSENGRFVTATEGGKYKTIFELDAFGNVIKQTDGKANERSFGYDIQNHLVEGYDGYGNKISYEYNAIETVSKVVLPDGAVTEYKYNYMGLLEKVSDDCGILYEAVYDKAGRMVKERSRADSEKVYEYDAAGRVTKVLCGGELVESYSYGPEGRSVIVKDGNGENYLYNYDAFGRLISERNRNGLEQNYFYDEEGELKSKNDFDGGTTTIIYSSDRTVHTVTYSDGSQNCFVYDAIGNIIEAENAYGKTIYQYDQGGLLVYQKDVTTGEEIHFEYDEAGNRTRLYSSSRETQYIYGKNNEIKEIFDNKQRLRVQLSYNKNGQEVLRKFGNGTEEVTLYDRAGRVTVKMQKPERGELLWGEGYLYGSDGKRTATVDNLGRVTLYEYNKKGQLETVYYPYTQELVNNLKKEAGENGLPLTADAGENRYLTSSEKASLIQLLNSMQYGLSYNLTNLQVFIKESYVYDKNGNRISKTTPYGIIEYQYDKENCLLSSGSRGQVYVSYTYDKMGNLLTEESAAKTLKYAYSSQNRMIYCEVLDKSEKTHAQTTYAYDAFGRRIIVQDKGEAALRTLYDGFTFDVIKQSPTFQNGLFTDSNQTGIRWGSTGRPTGDRYRYLDDENNKDSNRYFYLDENTYKTSNTRYRGERTQITVNGTLAAQSTSDYGYEYFSTDLLGSIRTTTDSYGSKKTAVSYDAFGSLVEGSLTSTTDHGYLGKQNDPTTSLYNYGYRDYRPKTSRFTTVDPIRDGFNWFAYVNNDPINFLDPDGFRITNFNAYSLMSNFKNENINNTTSTIDSSGCAMTGMANIITEYKHIINPNQKVYNEKKQEGSLKIITPRDLNVSSNFQGKTDCLNWNATANAYGLEATRSTSKKDAQTMIKKASASKEQEFVMIQVSITIGKDKTKQDVSHWVGHSGKTIVEKGTKWVEIVATSNNDANRDKKNSNWMTKNGKMYVKESAIEGAVVVKKKNK